MTIISTNPRQVVIDIIEANYGTNAGKGGSDSLVETPEIHVNEEWFSPERAENDQITVREINQIENIQFNIGDAGIRRETDVVYLTCWSKTEGTNGLSDMKREIKRIFQDKDNTHSPATGIEYVMLMAGGFGLRDLEEGIYRWTFMIQVVYTE